MFKHDPGFCIVCGAAHSTCGGAVPIEIATTPAKDARARAVPPLKADIVQATLPPGQFTTATYKRRRPSAPRTGEDET